MPMGATLTSILAGLVIALLVLDHRLLSRHPEPPTRAGTLLSIGVWAVAAAVFGTALFLGYQAHADVHGNTSTQNGVAALAQFVTALIVELTLSLDNLAVLVLILAYFKVPREAQPRAIFWCVLTSLVIRLGLISGTGALLHRYDWFVYILGVLILLAMVRLLVMPGEGSNLTRRPLIRLARRVLPVPGPFKGDALVARCSDGPSHARWVLTPLAPAVLVGATADVTYALDSIPAVFAVTADVFIAFAAHAFALLLLRPLDFGLQGTIRRFRYLKVTIFMVLLFLGLRLVLARPGGSAVDVLPDEWDDVELVNFTLISTEILLAVVLLIVSLGVGGSVLHAWMERRATGALSGSTATSGPRPSVAEDLARAVEIAQNNLWRLTILFTGLLVAVGGAIIIGPLPGPGGVIVFLAGLGILATEFVWAQRLLREVQRRAQQVTEHTDRVARKTPPWVVYAVIAIYFAVVALLALSGWVNRTLVILTGVGGLFPLGFWVWRSLRTPAGPGHGEMPSR
jgi:tellurite resistance protein TerC